MEWGGGLVGCDVDCFCGDVKVFIFWGVFGEVGVGVLWGCLLGVVV